jgi:diguanylate cyclase (GGDEF)-like protein/PAS domain S-box-containing protein
MGNNVTYLWIRSRIIALGVVLSACYWVIESIIDSYAFASGTVTEQVFSPKPDELWMRAVITFLILAFSAYANFLVLKHRRLEEICRESDRTRQALLNSAGDGAMLVSTDGTIDALNDKAAEALGAETSRIIGKNIFDLLPPDVASERRESARIVTETGRPLQFEDERDGRWYNVTIYPVTDDENGVVQLAVFGREITETKKMELELTRLSITDDLTGLYNQRHFIEKIEEEVDRARRVGYSLCLVIFDVDDFKTYNDTYGHLKGNEILKAIGAITLHSIRKDVDSAYRFGGDEFALILPYADNDTADEIIERIVSRTTGRLEGVTISSGIAVLGDGISAHDLIHLADQFMYRQKESSPTNRVAKGRRRTRGR